MEVVAAHAPPSSLREPKATKGPFVSLPGSTSTQTGGPEVVRMEGREGRRREQRQVIRYEPCTFLEGKLPGLGLVCRHALRRVLPSEGEPAGAVLGC